MDPKMEARVIAALKAGVPSQVRDAIGIKNIYNKRLFLRKSVSALTGTIKLIDKTLSSGDALRNIDKAQLAKDEYFATRALRLLHATAGGTTDATLMVAQYTPLSMAQITDGDVTGDAIPIGAIAGAEIKVFTNKQIIYHGTVADFMVASGAKGQGTTGDGIVDLDKICIITPEEVISVELYAGATAFLTNSAVQFDFIGVATSI